MKHLNYQQVLDWHEENFLEDFQAEIQETELRQHRQRTHLRQRPAAQGKRNPKHPY